VNSYRCVTLIKTCGIVSVWNDIYNNITKCLCYKLNKHTIYKILFCFLGALATFTVTILSRKGMNVY
jgi:hypothetical protein